MFFPSEEYAVGNEIDVNGWSPCFGGFAIDGVRCTISEPTFAGMQSSLPPYRVSSQYLTDWTEELMI